MAATLPKIGVVVVSFGSGDVILECLESLLASTGVDLRIVVVDNASPDDTCARIEAWASGAAPFQRAAGSPLAGAPAVPKPVAMKTHRRGDAYGELGALSLIHSGGNLGFAGGVNVGLDALRGQVDWFWVLNPDCAVPPATARAFADAAASGGPFSLMGGRVLYYSHPGLVQSDGGRFSRLTGVCSQVNAGVPVGSALRPDASSLDWISGACMIVSPDFLEAEGPMREDYFLYYEEVDWAFRRGARPLSVAPQAIVYHHGGTTIGTGSIGRRPSPFANYFNYRNRIRFCRRFVSKFPAGAFAYGLAKAAQLLLKGAPDEAYAIVAGMFETLPPPRPIRERLRGTKALAKAES